jgi:hypothetical protein
VSEFVPKPWWIWRARLNEASRCRFYYPISQSSFDLGRFAPNINGQNVGGLLSGGLPGDRMTNLSQEASLALVRDEIAQAFPSAHSRLLAAGYYRPHRFGRRQSSVSDKTGRQVSEATDATTLELAPEALYQ